ncbi:hypothetical protein DIPPA_17748 [Diplonema papillatum]|nr:hypothetical protein DIPPA_17748 [Diplonema papillatum]
MYSHLFGIAVLVGVCVGESAGRAEEWLRGLGERVSSTGAERVGFEEVSDPQKNTVPRKTPGVTFSPVMPTQIADPVELVDINPFFFDDVGLPLPSEPDEHALISSAFLAITSGDNTAIETYLPNAVPYAHCYTGWQFGYFAGQLGDGRAVTLGALDTGAHSNCEASEDSRSQPSFFELQLKGAGKTPYSRAGDGRAVVRSSIREYLGQEALFALGVPSSRSVACVRSLKEKVTRDKLYNGNLLKEDVAVVLRAAGAPGFIRFGSFEVESGKGRRGKAPAPNPVKLLESVLLLFSRGAHVDLTVAADWWDHVVAATARTVALWQCAGFAHGVLNTDNLAISGETIDFGPFGFVEHYLDSYIPNYSDEEGRYTYANQPEVVFWNLQKLSAALARMPAFFRVAPSPDQYWQAYNASFDAKMKAKFGLLTTGKDSKTEAPSSSGAPTSGVHTAESLARSNMCEDTVEHVERACPGMDLWAEKEPHTLSPARRAAEAMFVALRLTGCDLTGAFRTMRLLRVSAGGHVEGTDEFVREMVDRLCPTPAEYATLREREWRIRHQSPTAGGPVASHTDPNTKKTSDRSAWQAFLSGFIPILVADWERSRLPAEVYTEKRFQLMSAHNPMYIPRDWMLERAIEAAEKGDYTVVRHLRGIFRNPFSADQQADKLGYDRPPDAAAISNLVSCSS